VEETNAASTVQAALMAAGFPAAMVGPAVANLTASPTLAPNALSAIGNSDTKGKTDGQKNIFDDNKNLSIKKFRFNLNGDNATILK
jgi:hypothetical protein